MSSQMGSGLFASFALIDLTALHDLFQFGGDPLVGQFPPGGARHGDAGVPICNYGNPSGGLVRVSHIWPAKSPRPPIREYFLKMTPPSLSV